MRTEEIVTIPNKILREKAQKVSNFDIELQNLATKMVEKMRQYDGVGLAAPQIGVSKRIIVLEFIPRENDKKGDKEFPLMILINPVVTKFSTEKVVMLEGCLSLPTLEMEVKRPKEVNVTAQDLTGKNVKIRAKGLLARVLQHEIDHLNGILFTDHVKDVKNLKYYADLRCVFMGTPDFALPTLEALIVNNINIVGVITETDKPVGRKQEIEATPVKKVGQEFGLPVFQPESKSNLEQMTKNLQPDYVVLAAFGRILTKSVLDIPSYGILNVHPSMLPKYRGPSPVQTTILNGDKSTGITIMKLNEKMDEGDIIIQKEVPVSHETSEELNKTIWVEGAKLLIETLPLYLSNQIQPTGQNHSQATYSKKFARDDGLIDWEKPVDEIERMVRAYTPWPRAFTILDGKRLVIHKARIEDGKLVPELVQLEGKNPTNWGDFKRGFKGVLPDKLI